MITRRVVLHFPQKLVDKPIIYKLVKDYNLEFNILKASIIPGEGGLLILEIKGESKDYTNGIKYLIETGVKIEALSKDIIHDEKRCTHCGMCISFCLSGAFSINRETFEVNFDDEKCIVCELCIKACPVKAMELKF